MIAVIAVDVISDTDCNEQAPPAAAADEDAEEDAEKIEHTDRTLPACDNQNQVCRFWLQWGYRGGSPTAVQA